MQESIADHFTPTLAIALFLSTTIEMLNAKFDDARIAIFGATINGDFIDDTVEKETAAIMLLYLSGNLEMHNLTTALWHKRKAH